MRRLRIGIVAVPCAALLAILLAGPARAALQPPPSPSPSPRTPEERAREVEREELEPAPPSPSPAPSPSPTPTPRPTPSPTPTPEPSPSPGPTPTPLPPSPAPRPSASPSPETPRGEKPGATILEKIGTFQDIEDIDLTQLLRVTAGEEGARTADDEPGVVTVVSEEDIRRSGARTVSEVLETLAGFEAVTDSLGRRRVVVRGVPGGLASGGSENVLVLLNGARLNEAITGGATAVNLDIPVDNIKRIEVVRGPGSVLFGPGAFLAVVDIVTESPDTFRRDELTVGAGTQGDFQYNFRYGTTFHDVSLAGFMQFARTGGAHLEVPEDQQTGLDRTLAPLGVAPASRAPGETVDDGKSVDANLAVAWRDLIVNARVTEENVGGFVGLFDVLGRQNRLSNKQVVLDGAWRRQVRAGDLRVRAGYAESRIASFLDVLPPGFTLLRERAQIRFPSGVAFQENLNSRRVNAEALLDRRLARHHTLTAGLGLEHESTFRLEAKTNLDFFRQEPLSSFGPVPALVPDASRSIFSAFVQDTWSPTPRIGVTGGLRLDGYSDFGAHLDPRLAAVWRLPRDLNLRASYGHAVNTPTFLERFYSSPAAQANPDLEPSRVDTLDLGALVRRRDTRVSATVYATWVRDPIAPSGSASPLHPLPQFVNRTGIDARGLDLEASRTFPGNRSLRLVWSIQHAEDALTGVRIAGVPAHLARLSANLPAGRYLIVSPALTLRSARPRAAGDARGDLGGYGLFDVVLRGRNFHPALEVSAVVRDLFDAGRFDPSPLGGLPGDYPRLGRTAFVKVKYRF